MASCYSKTWAIPSYLSQLNPQTVKDLYADALQSLLHLQQTDCDLLPVYNEQRLRTELDLMPEWFLKTHLGIADEDIPYDLIQQTFDALVESAVGQPVAFVHRDYHSRNLMLLTGEEQPRHHRLSGCRTRPCDLRSGVPAT